MDNENKWEYHYDYRNRNGEIIFDEVAYKYFKDINKSISCIRGEELVIVDGKYERLTDNEVTDRLIAKGEDDIEAANYRSPLRAYERAKDFKKYINDEERNPIRIELALDIVNDADAVEVKIRDEKEGNGVINKLIELGFPLESIADIIAEYMGTVVVGEDFYQGKIQ